MNYYKGRSLSFAGLRAIEVEVECVQSRRLPFLQIIGASVGAAGEQRERVMAALESSGFRLPRRRLTLRYGPDLHGISLENHDCAAALAILGSAQSFPAERGSTFFALGALSLDGSLQPVTDRAALRAWLRMHPRARLILPWEESAELSEEQEGGGFRRLEEVVAFLRSGESRAPRARARPLKHLEISSEIQITTKLSASETRLAAIAAAGGHHLLLVDAEEDSVHAVATAAHRLLPNLVAHEGGDGEDRSETLLSVLPFCELKESEATALLRPDRKLGTWGELSRAHGGLLLLRDFENKNAALAPLFEAMMEGSLRALRGGRAEAHACDPLVVAGSAPCDCGGNWRMKRACICRPPLKERRLRTLAKAPFDLRSFGCERLSVPGTVKPKGLPFMKVKAARARMISRQGKPNGKLRLPEALRAKPWQPEAAEWLRVGDRKLGATEALARVALTVSDLRDGRELSREDLLEAWHHVSGLGFEGVGISPSRGSVPERNSTAMP